MVKLGGYLRPNYTIVLLNKQINNMKTNDKLKKQINDDGNNNKSFDFHRVYPTKEFAELVGITPRTLYGKWNKQQNTNPTSKMIKKNKNGKLLFNIENIKEIVSHKMYDIIMEFKATLAANKAYRNTINGMIDGTTLASHLIKMEWAHFITISYKDEVSSDEVFRRMATLYNTINSKYNKAEIRMMFTSEHNRQRNGYHSHVVLFIKGHNHDVKKIIRDEFIIHNVHIKPYDKYLGGLFYIEKQGLQGTDWDYLHHNYAPAQ